MRRLLLLGVVVTTAAYFLGTNIPALVERGSYLGYHGILELVRVGQGLHVPAILVAWVFVFSGGSTKGERWTALGVLTALFVIDLAVATRALLLFPLALLLAYWLTRGRIPPLRIAVPALVVAVALYSAPLHLRGGTEGIPEEGRHGLIPYGSLVVSEPVAVFVPNASVITQNALQGLPLTAWVTERGELQPGDLWASLNPVPNHFTGFDPEAPYLRVDRNIPFNAVGMLGNLGTPVLIAYFAVTGGALALLWRFAHSTMARATLGRPLLVGTGVIIGLVTLQYPLRTSFRLTTILVIATVAFIWLGGGFGQQLHRAGLSSGEGPSENPR